MNENDRRIYSERTRIQHFSVRGLSHCLAIVIAPPYDYVSASPLRTPCQFPPCVDGDRCFRWDPEANLSQWFGLKWGSIRELSQSTS